MKRLPIETCAADAQPVNRSTLLVDAIHRWLCYYDPGRKPDSIKTMRYTLRQLTDVLGDREVGSITRDDIARLMIFLREKPLRNGSTGISGNGVRFILKLTSSFFTWCHQDRIIEINPVQLRRLPSLPREQPHRVPFRHDQYRAVLAVAREGRRHQEYWPSAIIIAWHTGLRCRDVATLRWRHDAEGGGSCVDFENEIIVARPSKREAVRQRLEIPMDAELYQHLQELIVNRRQEFEANPFVLPLMRGRLFGRRDLHSQFRRICDAAGLFDHSFHSFRHGFVTRLINSGADPITIGSMTGQTIEQVQEYCHVSNLAKKYALARAREAMHAAKLNALGVGGPKAIEI